MAKDRNEKGNGVTMDVSEGTVPDLPEAIDTSETEVQKPDSGAAKIKMMKGRPMKRSKNDRKMKDVAKANAKNEKSAEKNSKNEGLSHHTGCLVSLAKHSRLLDPVELMAVPASQSQQGSTESGQVDMTQLYPKAVGGDKKREVNDPGSQESTFYFHSGVDFTATSREESIDSGFIERMRAEVMEDIREEIKQKVMQEMKQKMKQQMQEMKQKMKQQMQEMKQKIEERQKMEERPEIKQKMLEMNAQLRQLITEAPWKQQNLGAFYSFSSSSTSY